MDTAMKSPDTRSIDASLLQKSLVPGFAATCAEYFEPGAMTPSTKPTWDMQISEGNFFLAHSLVSSDFQNSTATSACSKLPRKHGLKCAQALLADLYVDFVAFTGNQDRTRGFDPIQLSAGIQQSRRPGITISKKLKVPREQVMAKSLLVPSGAYLSWLAMYGDNATD
jgi:hypothetical protein